MEIKELKDSRSVDFERLDGKEVVIINGALDRAKATRTRNFIITGAGEDEQGDVEKLLFNTAGADFMQCKFKSASVKYNGGNLYSASMTYESRTGETMDESSDNAELFLLASFDTTGKTEEMFVSRGTIKQVVAPDFGSAINVDEEGNVKGCTVVSPKSSFDLQTTVAEVSMADMVRWASITGTVNSNAFNGCAAGTLLYLGAKGSQNKDGTWNVTHSFEFAANRDVVFTNPNGNRITLPVGGHDYVWFRYKAIEKADGAGGVYTIYQPQYGYVETVYPTTNFTF